MERTPDFRISRSCIMDDDFRKIEGLQCIEWNIENFKSLLREKPLECITSPIFQMGGASWNISISPTTEELYLVKWKSGTRRHCFTYLLTIEINDGDICWSFLDTFLWNESQSLVSDESLCVLEYFNNRMTCNNLRVSLILFPGVEQRDSAGVARGAETITREGSNDAAENVTATIFPPLKMESVQGNRILPGSRMGDNFRIIDGLLCVEWNIKNYHSLLPGNRLELMTSPTFQMKDERWKLFLDHTAEEVFPILYLSECASESKRHSFSCQITIQIKETVYLSDLNTFLFNESKRTATGASVSLELLSKNRTSDNLRVFCIVFPEELEQTSVTSESYFKGVKTHEGIDILSSNLKDLFLKEENCDFVIKVKGRDFHVHRAILAARSPVLSAMLQHDMTEKNSGTTNIDDCEPDVFELFLSYLYSGRVKELSWSHATHLYTLGDKYDLPHLRKECLRFMERNLSIEAFCDAIALAVKHKEKTLVTCAEGFFLKNVKSILVTNEWQLLLQSNPFICNELFLKCCK